MDPYGLLLRNVLFPVWEGRLRKRPTLEILESLRATETASLDELIAMQTAELRRLATHCVEYVPYYKRIFSEAGLAPEDITDPGALSALPALTRQIVKDTVAQRCSTGPRPPTVRKTTGGTTGEPLVIRYDSMSEHWRQAVKWRGFEWCGFHVGDRALHYWGEPTKSNEAWMARFKRGADRAVKREKWVDCTPRSDADMAQAVRAIRKHRPSALFCYSQAGAALARYINRVGARRWGNIHVICGAEPVFPKDRAELERAFGPWVHETYGCREVMLIGCECRSRTGLHVSMENLIVEVVVADGHGGERPAEPGETGEVLITDLHNYGCPLIRYANGDMARMAKIARCPCGRAHPRIEAVEGRVTETLIDANGDAVGGMVINLIFSPLADVVRQFQAVQHLDGSVTLKIIPTPSLRDHHLEHVRTNCDRYLPGVSVITERVQIIPLTSSGKRRVVYRE